MPSSWDNIRTINKRSFICGYCGYKVAGEKGYFRNASPVEKIYICPYCSKPTFFDKNKKQTPGSKFGETVDGIADKNVRLAYEEARVSFSAGAYTGAVLLCRKLLMNIANHHGAPEGRKFIKYIEFLNSKNFIPPNGKEWIDQVRQKGNEATHEIPQINEKDAKLMILFCEMLLRFVYEFPNLVKDNKK